MRKIYFPVFIITYLFLHPAVFAQQSFSLNAGTSFLYAKDLIVSEAVYSGPMFQIETSYAFQWGKSNNSVDFEFQHGRVESELGNNWKVLAPKLAYSHNYLLHRGNAFAHRLGGSLEVDGFWANSELRTGSTIREGRTSGYLNNSLLLEYLAGYSIGKNSVVSTELSLPLLSYLVRPGYSTLDPDGVLGDKATFWNVLGAGQFESFVSQKAFSLNFRFEESVTERIAYNINYNYNFYQTNTEKAYAGINQQINFGMTWKW